MSDTAQPSDPGTGPADTELLEMPVDECIRLLGTVSIGRLAVGRGDDPPLVVPVNYILDDDMIVFRTDPGAKLDLLRENAVSFQVDAIDPYHRTGWSVLVRGVARETTETPTGRSLQPWAGGPKAHWISLPTTNVTGRRIKLAEFPDARESRRGYL